MIRFIRELFAWELVRETGVWAYWQNRRTGRRKVTPYVIEGHQPIDAVWLQGASQPRPIPYKKYDNPEMTDGIWVEGRVDNAKLRQLASEHVPMLALLIVAIFLGAVLNENRVERIDQTEVTE